MNVSMVNDSVYQEQRYYGMRAIEPDTEELLRYFLIGFLLLIFPAAVLLNGFLIFLIVVAKSLHRSVYFLALQLAVVDIVITLVITPVTIISAFAGEWILGPELCSLTLFIQHILRHGRYWLMFIFVCNRFISVFYPFFYHKHERKMVVIFSLLAWSITFLFAILPIILDCEEFSRIAWYCTGGNGCTDKFKCQNSRLVTTLITNIMGSLVPVIMYIVLFAKAKVIQRTLISISNEKLSSEQRKRNFRINVTFFWIFLALFGINLVPFSLFVFGNTLISALGLKPSPEFVIATTIFRSLYNILPIIDSIAIMRNAEVREAIRKLRGRVRIKLISSDSSQIQSPSTSSIS